MARGVPGVSSALAERVTGGRYLDVRVRPEAAARYCLSQAAVQELISTVVGGEPVAETIEGPSVIPWWCANRACCAIR